MAAISREEEQRIKEWQQRTGGGCKDKVPTIEERIESLDLEIKANLAILRRAGESQNQ